MLRPTQVINTSRAYAFAYGALTLLGWLSQYHSTDVCLCNCSKPLQRSPVYTYYPRMRNACRLARIGFRLLPFRSPLLRVSLRFLLCPATEMFHFADSAPASRVSGLRRRGCPIRIPPDLRSLAPPRGFSQLTASFIAVRCHGILRVPFSLYSPKNTCLLFNCQCTRGNYRQTIEDF